MKPLSRRICRALLGSGLCLTVGSASPVGAAEVYFNPALLSHSGAASGATPATDLSRFAAGEQLPGTYHVDIYVNGAFIDSRDVPFIDEGHGQLVPGFTLADYRSLGLNSPAVPSLARMAPDTVMTDISRYVPAATTTFLFARQRLDISLPQQVMTHRAAGYVDPATWDQGVPAALLNYALTGSHTQSRGPRAAEGRANSVYANLRSGLNWGAWRLRNYSTYSQTSDARASSPFQVISTYLQRDVQALNSQLTLGETSTPGDVFDSVSFRGAQLASDDSMLPNSLRGFAPIIRGIAQSSAQVSVRQNGHLIYQTNVSPGAFEIGDLNPASMSGDLQVTVRESDGRERTFTQAYSSLAVMQREGQRRFALTAGQLTTRDGREPHFVQGTLVIGLPHNVTAYGGVLVAEKYLAVTGGVGLSLGDAGAVSADVTQASATLLNAEQSTGQSYRIRYSKNLATTNTTLNLAAYRYSTAGYYGFEDANTHRPDLIYTGQATAYRKRSEFEFSLSQSLGDAGSVYVSSTQRDFWGREGSDRTYALGYNGSLSGVSYGVNVSETRSSATPAGRNTDRRLAFNLSVPLSRFLPGYEQGRARHSLQANYGLTTGQGQAVHQTLGVSGTALSDGQLNYNLSQTLENQGGGYGAAVGATYNGGRGTLTGGYNYSETQQQVTYGVSGGVVAHAHGVTLSPPLGDTIALVRAPGAGGMKVNGQTGLNTDGRGYAVMPYLTPYRRTDVSVDPTALGSRVALDNTSQPVTPTKGAVVVANFQTNVGQQALFTLLNGGKPVPFGALVTLASREEDVHPGNKEETASIVGDDGQVYLSGLPDKGTLRAQWGPGADQHCRATFALSAAPDDTTDRTAAPASVHSVCQ